VVASATPGTKDSARGVVHTYEQLTHAGSASAQNPPIQVEASPARGANALDIMLLSRRVGTLNHDNVCGLLSECLQDVSSSVLVLHIFVACYFTF
jgi:hypothetical protein